MISLVKGFAVVLLGSALVATVTASSAPAFRLASATVPRAEASTESSDLRPADPHKELRHLAKDLKLKRDQRVGVGSILQERAREIQLLLDVESLSQKYRAVLAAKVVQDSNAQIATLLRNNQKRKFDKELAKDHEPL